MEQLKRMRKEFSLSQRDFAALTGINRTRLAMFETSKRPVPEDLQAFVDLVKTSSTEKQSAKNSLEDTLKKQEQTNLDRIIKKTKVKLEGLQLQSEDLEIKMENTEKMISVAAFVSTVSNLSEIRNLQATLLRRQSTEKLYRQREQLIQCRLQIAALNAILNEAGTLSIN